MNTGIVIGFGCVAALLVAGVIVFKSGCEPEPAELRVLAVHAISGFLSRPQVCCRKSSICSATDADSWSRRMFVCPSSR